MKTPPDDKGKFSTAIGDDVIEAALKSVDKAAGVEVEVEPPAANEELESLKAQLELSMAKGRELMGKVREEHEKMLRAAADLENYKKRAQKEKEEVQRFGSEKLLKDFLPVADNIDRALAHATDLEAVTKGLEMIKKQLTDTLAKHGVKSFSAQGQPFDPNLHEAMSQAESAELPPNHVLAEMVRGYTLNDRLVRPALVVVSKAPAAPPAEAAPAPEAAPAEAAPEPSSAPADEEPKSTE